MQNNIDKNLIEQVFKTNEFKAWLFSKRWFGDKLTLSNLSFEVNISYFQIIAGNVFLILINIKKKDYSKTYFLPLIYYEEIGEILETNERTRMNIINLTERTFTKKIALTFPQEAQDKILNLNLLEAEYCAHFWRKLLFDKKIAEQFPALKLDLKLYEEQFEQESDMKNVQTLVEAGLYPDKYGILLEQLGGGSTTNILFLLKILDIKGDLQPISTYVVKSYKEYSERIEPKTLYVLVKNNFPNAPKIYGMIRLCDKETIGIIQNVPNIGNVGDIYWNELNTMIFTIFKDLNQNFDNLKEKDEINKVIDDYCGKSLKVSEKISIYIKKLHKALVLDGDLQYKKERVDSKKYLSFYSDKLKQKVNRVQEDMKNKAESAFYHSPKVSSILLDILDILDKIRMEFGNEAIKIQPIHQDLHMQQILYNEVNGGYEFYFIDFEGDPQLTYTEKKSRFPIEKDLGSFLRSLSYIKFNTLLKFIEEKVIDKSKFEVPEEFLFNLFFKKSAKASKNLKILEVVLYLLNAWEAKMMAKLFKKSLKLSFDLISYYSIERALYELEYELLFRPSKVIIPLLGLKEIIEKS
jgi:hypothetical protein